MHNFMHNRREEKEEKMERVSEKDGQTYKASEYNYNKKKTDGGHEEDERVKDKDR